MQMTNIQIEERNGFNTMIELIVKTGRVVWTIEKGPKTCLGDWVEKINGIYSGVAYTAGFISKNSWIEHDHKSFLGFNINQDWGINTVLTSTDTSIVMEYWSYKKGKFTMTWTMKET